MKTISTTAIVALMTASIGLSAIAPVMAQDASAPAAPATSAATPSTEPTAPVAPPAGRSGPRGPGGFGEILGFERGAEGIEIALVRLSHAIELTTEQQALLDTLKTDALAAAEDFETATADLRPQAPVEGEAPAMPDVAGRLENRIALERAHLAALEAVQPSFSAFFDSLTDEQKADLMPQPGERMGRGGDQRGPGRDGGPGRHWGPGAEGGPAADGAPMPQGGPEQGNAPAAPADAATPQV